MQNEEIAIFDQSRFISEMIQVRAIVTTEGEYETVPKLSNGAIWPCVTRNPDFNVTILFNVK